MVNIRRSEYERLRQALREIREERRLSQFDVAHRLEHRIKQEQISRYERGERRLDVVELLDICRALEVWLGEVLDRANLDWRQGGPEGKPGYEATPRHKPRR
ncbi:helix-turn-helix domain-containing protein [Phytoactinopolyspora halotolerans]|uniref:Helix-turn-helix transcriptional regulator n=1 Tax=Phytoactinopolyspora halotolerans TaxID=1981512 RepID=A0A6L9SH03_9ACTN|nr:helix-turn-helix transcriptional regulator [Phytoactinopolyspora halotolerans]NEE03924.1 helix-turn-helix transcriptional regulator [Phytoactinopolyspora halotolerans]